MESIQSLHGRVRGFLDYPLATLGEKQITGWTVLLVEVGRENPDILDAPAPVVRLLEFGSSGLHFERRAWSRSLIHRMGNLINALNFAIHDKFKEHKIVIPYPDREIHIRRRI